MSDVWTVVWKEARALAANRGSVFAGYAIIVFVFGVFVLLDSGPAIAQGNVERPLMVFSALAVVLASSQTARSFAGEREAKTLASLLCTRIRDRSLFVGKAVSIVLFTCGMLTAAGVLHVAAVNLVSRLGGKGWLLYQARPGLLPFMFLLPFSIACFTSVVGVLISLKVHNTRGAYLLNLFCGAPALGVTYAAIGYGPSGASGYAVLGSLVLVFGILVLGFASLAVRRFRRETLLVES